MTSHFLGLSGFAERLPLVSPGAPEDLDWYWRQVQRDLQAGRHTLVRVMMAGRPIDLHLNPATLPWWYIASESQDDAVLAEPAVIPRPPLVATK